MLKLWHLTYCTLCIIVLKTGLQINSICPKILLIGDFSIKKVPGRELIAFPQNLKLSLFYQIFPLIA